MNRVVKEMNMESTMEKWIDCGNLNRADKQRIKKQTKMHMGAKWCRIAFFFQRILRINSHVPWPVHFTSFVGSPGKIKYKNHSNLSVKLGCSAGCYINSMNGIEIGFNLRVGPGVKIISADHDLNAYEKHILGPPIKLGDDIWLGSNAVILPGVELGNHVVVAAGAVVNKSFPQGNCVLAGVPAKVVKELPDYHGKRC